MRLPARINLVNSATTPATLVSCRTPPLWGDLTREGAGCPAGCLPWDGVGPEAIGIDVGLISEFGTEGWILRMASPMSIMPSNRAKAMALPANQRCFLARPATFHRFGWTSF